MSEFKCEVVKVGPILKHPNAETLGITNVWNYPCVVKLGEIQEGDLAVYVPVDSIVDTSVPEFAFLGNHPRIKAKKLRGIFSMGLLVKSSNWAFAEGEDVAKNLNIKKWEEPDEAISQNGNLKTGGDCESVPFFFVQYDLPHYRRYSKSLNEGEEVVITEKIHGCNSRFVHYDGRIWAGSHKTWKKPDEACLWWKVAKQYDLDKKLMLYSNLIFYGETYGWVQDLRYSHQQGEVSFKVFDIFDLQTGRWLNWDVMTNICKIVGLDTVPVVYRGPWHPDLLKMAEGTSQLGDNMKEGIVISPVLERFDLYCGRLKLKYPSDSYLLRHEKNPKVTEAH